jgi:hypothetical protein
MTFLRPLFAVLLLGISGAHVRAGDVWVIRSSESSYDTQLCSTLSTESELLFQNNGTSDAVVRLLGISNGGSTSTPEVNVPATRTATVSSFGVPVWIASARWWAVHRDVPDAVTTTAQLQLGTDHVGCPPIPRPPVFSPNRGTLAVPVFRSLVPAGTIQRHLGTHVGNAAATLTAVVFNAANAPASAHVQLFRGCDDTVVAERTLTIAPNSTDSVSLPLTIDCSSPARSVLASGFDEYTTVTVDQPSLSMVIAVANVAAPVNDVAVGVIVAPPVVTRTRAVRR